MLTPAEGEVVVLRDMRGGRALATFPHRGEVIATGFGPDGEQFYTLSREHDSRGR